MAGRRRGWGRGKPQESTEVSEMNKEAQVHDSGSPGNVKQRGRNDSRSCFGWHRVNSV